LAGQSGGKASDRDIKIFKNIVGDPQEWAGNQQKYLSKLDTIEQILEMNQGIVEKNLPRSNPAARPAAPGVAASPMSPAPGAPSMPAAAPAAEMTATGPNGEKLFLRNGQWSTQ
jgi:hypothetical protein